MNCFVCEKSVLMDRKDGRFFSGYDEVGDPINELRPIYYKTDSPNYETVIKTYCSPECSLEDY